MIESMRDGEWWAWNGGNGGNCPVHPNDMVQVQYEQETRREVLAESDDYTKPARHYWPAYTDQIIAFRVISRHHEVRTLSVAYVNGLPSCFLSDADGLRRMFPGQHIEVVQMAEGRE